MQNSLKANSKAVSPVVGFVMILAIIAMFMATIQSQFLPAWNKQVEARSFNRLTSEVLKIPEILTSQTSSTTLKLDVGVSYPKYPLLVNPPPVAGYVEFLPENITINGTIAGTGSWYNKTFKTSAILIHPNYLYSADRYLIYDYTGVFENWSGYSVVLVNQTAFSRTTVVIPILNTSDRIVSGMTVPLYFYLVGKSYGVSLENLSITFEVGDRNEVSYWTSVLQEIYGLSNVTSFGNEIVVYVGSATLYTPAWSVSSKQTNPKVERIVSRVLPLNNPVYVDVGGVIPVGVVVLDQFGNAYPGIPVNATVSYGSTYASVYPSKLSTNINGEATFYVKGLSAGNATVEFLASNTSTNVTVHVLAQPVPTATPVPALVKFVPGENNLTLLSYNYATYNYSGLLNATVQVLDASGNPVKGVPVTISLNVLYYKGGGGGWLVGSTTAYTTTLTTDSTGTVVLREANVSVPLYYGFSYKFAYTQLSASCAGITTSYTNYTNIGGYWGGVPTPSVTTPYVISYP